MFMRPMAMTGSLVLALAGLAGTASLAQAGTAAGICRHVTGPFHEHHNEITDSVGGRYIPYGIVVTGLGNPHWAQRQPGDAAEITASAGSWCANTVELQVYQLAMFNADGSVNSTFLGLVESEVSQALGLGLAVAIDDQTEGSPANSGLPEAQTKAFWKVLEGIYGNNTDVIFDLFNEPRRVGGGSDAAIWRYWRNGGTYQGTKYIGMQTLARYVRGLGSRNLFWIEGPRTGGTLQYIRQYQVTKAGPLEYGVNHPGGVASPHNAAYWNTRFGNNASAVPMTDTEWTNYASTRSCWANAPKSVPALLHYLAQHRMGLMAWTLAPGVLVESSNLADPTRIKSNWACKNGLDQGAGHQIMQFFRKYNS
jgi:Cellulase (glycosyl hydrolase family 5)